MFVFTWIFVTRKYQSSLQIEDIIINVSSLSRCWILEPPSRYDLCDLMPLGIN